MTFRNNKMKSLNRIICKYFCLLKCTPLALAWCFRVLVSSILGLPRGRSCRRHPAQKGIHFAPRPQSPPDRLRRWFKVNWAQKKISHSSYASSWTIYLIAERGFIATDSVIICIIQQCTFVACFTQSAELTIFDNQK